MNTGVERAFVFSAFAMRQDDRIIMTERRVGLAARHYIITAAYYDNISYNIILLYGTDASHV